jgi:hypothetical protein
MATLADKLAALETLSPAQLRVEWRRVYGTMAPAISSGLLMHGIAYRLQEKASRSKVMPMARLRGTPVRSTIKPGTRLLRSWNGRSVAVTATDNGFLFEDRPYRSLSAIAREVTGTAWSGPRFFGLNAHG